MIFDQTSGICLSQGCEGCLKNTCFAPQCLRLCVLSDKTKSMNKTAWSTCPGQREESRCFASAWVSLWWAHIWWDIGKRERQNGLYPVERQIWKGKGGDQWNYLPPGAMVTCGSGLPTRAMYGSMALSQLSSMLMSLDLVTTKGLEEAQCLGWHLRSCW